MPSIANDLRESIYPECEITINEPSTYLSIRNSKRENELMSVKIKIEGLTKENFVAFELEKIKNKNNTALIKIDWINKRTDGIIYTYYENTHKFMIIEVKTQAPKGCESQFKSMHSFLCYLTKALELNNKLANNSEKIELSKVLISKRVNKNYINPRKVLFNDKINANEICYKSNEKDSIPIQELLDCKFMKI